MAQREYRHDFDDYTKRDKKVAIYEFSAEGPKDAPLWTAIVTVNGTEWGRGQGMSKGAAKEAAAQQAVGLYEQGYRFG